MSAFFCRKTAYHLVALGSGMEGHEGWEIKDVYSSGSCAILCSLQEKVRTLGFKDVYEESHRSDILLEPVT